MPRRPRRGRCDSRHEFLVADVSALHGPRLSDGGGRAEVSRRTIQAYLLCILNGLEMPDNIPAAKAYITPPDPRVQAKVPAIYIWPTDGEENRSTELGGTIPRNNGPGTPSGTKGLQHQFDVYVTWFSNNGRQADPMFPAIVDTVMMALRYSMPNPAELTDPATNLTIKRLQHGRGNEVPDRRRSHRRRAVAPVRRAHQVTVWEVINA